jgi:hypothetical protein
VASPTEHYLVTTNPAELAAYADNATAAPTEGPFLDLEAADSPDNAYDAVSGSEVDLDAG